MSKLRTVFGDVYSRLKTALLPEFHKAWSKDFDSSVKTLQRDLSRVQAELTELRRAHQDLVVKEWTQSREPLFPSRDPVKQDFHLDQHLAGAPAFTQRVWRFFDEDVVAGVLAPALHRRFRDAVVDHYAETAGGGFAERAVAIPHRGFAGRLHLRRPGYHLKPHLDPKRVVITGLVYFARPGDSEAYGTQLFRVGKPFTSGTIGKFYPEDEGLPLELARTVPFRPNTLFAFVNSKAAHGATLPPDASLRERYAYQFYVKPRDGDLKKLLLELPPESRTNWARFLDEKVTALD